MNTQFTIGQIVYVMPDKPYSALPMLKRLPVAVIVEIHTAYEYDEAEGRRTYKLESASGNKADFVMGDGYFFRIEECPDYLLRDAKTSSEAELLRDLGYYDGLGHVFWRGKTLTETEYERQQKG